LMRQLQENPIRDQARLLAIAPFASPTPFADQTLPQSLLETRCAVLEMGGKLLRGRHATVSNLASLQGNHQILHFATHSAADTLNPSRSYLMLQPSPADRAAIHLQAADIYRRELNTDLVVLSSCYSGLGKITFGEGVQDLGRAFAFSGVKSTLVSLWRVHDYASGHIMRLFYHSIHQGLPRSRALQSATRTFLAEIADPITAHPQHWGNFALVGDPRPMLKPQ
jgi:CHAT domain-containing protein